MTPLLGVSKASIQLLVTQLYTNTIHFYAIFLVLLGNHLYTIETGVIITMFKQGITFFLQLLIPLS